MRRCSRCNYQHYDVPFTGELCTPCHIFLEAKQQEREAQARVPKSKRTITLEGSAAWATRKF